MRFEIATALLFLAACGAGDGEGLNQDGQPLGQAQTSALVCGTAGVTPPVTVLPGSAIQPTFASIQANLFSVTCAVSGCHAGAAAQQGLRLDAGFSAGNLICVQSPRDPTLTRVVPGDPDNSLIIQKLEGKRFDGAQILGDRMPDGGPYLQQSTIDVIRLWIANGALQ